MGVVYYYFPFIKGLNPFECYITFKGSDFMYQFKQSWNPGEYQSSSIGRIDKELDITIFNRFIVLLEI